MNKLRLIYKKSLSKFKAVPSFCKVCGRDIRDFIADDKVWEQVSREIKGNTLCYNCFCDICSKLGLPSVWKLNYIKK